MTVEGLKVSRSRHGPQETLDRFEVAIARYGMTIFARIDHGAERGEERRLRPPGVRQPRAGTPAMQAVRTLAIDLPLKVLIWQDDKDMTWLAYNDSAWLFRRHGVVDDGTVDVMHDVLECIAGEATGR